MLLSAKFAAVGVLAATFASPAYAESPSQSPEPVAGQPSCNGLVIADFNHNSGDRGASGNPTASAGPGFFLGSGTHDAIENLARAVVCGSSG